MLSERIASASVEQTRDMLEEAWEYVHGPTPQPNFDDWNEGNLPPEYIIHERFATFLVVEAYHDAAMMLIPEGWTYEGRQGPSGFPHMWTLSTIKCGDARYTTVTGRGRSAPLAIAAAAVKVKEMSDAVRPKS